MSEITCFDRCRNPKISLPTMSAAGHRETLSHMNDDEYIETNGIRFTIFDDKGTEFVTGLFCGGQQDRDVPLETARIFARDLASPVRIEYADGVSYSHSERFGFAVRE